MSSDVVKIEHAYGASNRLGQLLIRHETLREERPMISALFALLTLVHSEPHESGRGIRFIFACEQDCTAFDAIEEEGAEIPEYRVESVHDGHFADPELERRRVESGRFGFAFVRKIIVRVQALDIGTAAHAPATRH
jgi:hypothetical protein